MSAIPSSPHIKIIVTRRGIKMIELTKKPAAIENSHLYYLNIIKLSGTRETMQSIGPHVSYLTLK